MLTKVEKAAEAYNELYKDKVVLVKVSGAEIEGENFPKLIEDIRWLIEKQIRVVLIFGGGDQITQKYKDATGESRPKIDGIGVTTPEVLTKGVLPALGDIRGQLQKVLPAGTVFVEPEAMRCEIHPDERYGLVGIPKEIDLPDAPVSAIGFVGTAEDPSKYPPALLEKTGAPLLNVNADDIAVALVRQYKTLINELIFVTKKRGVEDIHGEIAPLLTDVRIRRILADADPDIPVDGGMKKKLEAILSVLQAVGKIAITDAKSLMAEIEKWKGEGTFCVDTKQLVFAGMLPIEEAIFDAVFEEYERSGKFRYREPAELDDLKHHHFMLRIKNSPIGGLSLVPKEDGWLELSSWWALAVGNGLGQILLDSAREKVGANKLYAMALDPGAVEALKANKGFKCLGKLSEARAEHTDEIPPFLKDETKYDVTKRDSYVFVGLPYEEET